MPRIILLLMALIVGLFLGFIIASQPAGAWQEPARMAGWASPETQEEAQAGLDHCREEYRRREESNRLQYEHNKAYLEALPQVYDGDIYDGDGIYTVVKGLRDEHGNVYIPNADSFAPEKAEGEFDEVGLRLLAQKNATTKAARATFEAAVPGDQLLAESVSPPETEGTSDAAAYFSAVSFRKIESRPQPAVAAE